MAKEGQKLLGDTSEFAVSTGRGIGLGAGAVKKYTYHRHTVASCRRATAQCPVYLQPTIIVVVPICLICEQQTLTL